MKNKAISKFLDNAQTKHPFVLSILSEPKLFLVGDKDDIESITG